jgi:hypothetical protein
MRRMLVECCLGCSLNDETVGKARKDPAGVRMFQQSDARLWKLLTSQSKRQEDDQQAVILLNSPAQKVLVSVRS